MPRADRLTTLISRFTLKVLPAPLDEATLVVTSGDDDGPSKAVFLPRQCGFDIAPGRVLVAALVDWGGISNPLVSALPPVIEVDLTRDAETMAIAQLMKTEIAAQRCGAASVVNRLGEVLVVRILRGQIEAGSTRPGVLAGLSDPRISRAIVAIHDRPGRNWRNEDLADLAGLSRSRFAEMFLTAVGEPPAAYLRKWRLTLARQDVEKGHRVDAIARRYGYGSPEGFTRAFRKQFGALPITLRPKPSA
ncbi:AraC family transcriptional regulator [Antarcticimicrobium sediminis]|uniref:AraC family transcriptional regulator n=1 Tax=Antarcticimicrobium sediminis TaxID=2546227 RepID=A0A4R5EGZ1_9RHOB|nr:AraC family transcriptional regulator [Antarcticimicrobium sediminis]TDE33628.1 AraC family transcriptional regulator [Antarcticimicrobium sediminis]